MKPLPRCETGDIYLIQAGSTVGPLKIGFTTKLRQRFRALQTSCPWKLQLIGIMHGEASLEDELHAWFVAYRMRGEWFRPARAIFEEFGVDWLEPRHIGPSGQMLAEILDEQAPVWRSMVMV